MSTAPRISNEVVKGIIVKTRNLRHTLTTESALIQTLALDLRETREALDRLVAEHRYDIGDGGPLGCDLCARGSHHAADLADPEGRPNRCPVAVAEQVLGKL